MSAFEKACNEVAKKTVESFTFNLQWMIDGGKRISISKFKTIRYTWGLYMEDDCHRGKKGELVRYSVNEPKECNEFILFGVGDVSLEAKKLKNPVLKTEEVCDYIIYIKDKKVQFIK